MSKAPEMAAGRGITALLTTLIVLAIAGTAVSMALLWPDKDALRTVRPVNPYAGVTFLTGTVQDIDRGTCPGSTEDRGADGAIPAETNCSTATVRLDPTPGIVAPGVVKLVPVPVPPEVERAGMGRGDRLRLARYPSEDGQPEAFAYVDYDRTLPLAWLAAIFAVLVVVVARFKGLAAILGLAVVYPTITGFMLPAVRAGENPVLVAVTGAAAIMLVVLYLAHGVNAKTTIALLGTMAGLLLTAAVAWWAADAAHLDGLTTEENFQLSRLTTGGGLNGIILCGVIVAGLGVLNDVTITQASAVWEMRALAPEMSAAGLFASGMRVGRDHLASTVYTIAFAYIGAGLPLLLLIDLYQQPIGQAVTGGEIAEEVVRTLVGSIGLILAIPLTTAIAAVVAVGVARPASAATAGGSPVSAQAGRHDAGRRDAGREAMPSGNGAAAGLAGRRRGWDSDPRGSDLRGVDGDI